MFKKQKAFTLVELMITVAIAAIVIGLAIPSFTSQMANNRSVALGEDFVTAVNFARSEAIRRKVKVSLCASSDGNTCAAANGWQDGFIAFVDRAAADNTANPALTDMNNPQSTILRAWKKQDPNAVITVTQGAGATFIRYTALGILARVNASTVVIKAELKGCKGDAARTITIGPSGMVSVKKEACTTTP